jgi:hypothetical protein
MLSFALAYLSAVPVEIKRTHYPPGNGLFLSFWARSGVFGQNGVIRQSPPPYPGILESTTYAVVGRQSLERKDFIVKGLGK